MLQVELAKETTAILGTGILINGETIVLLLINDGSIVLIIVSSFNVAGDLIGSEFVHGI